MGTFGALHTGGFGRCGGFAITAKFTRPFAGGVLHTGEEVTKAPFAHRHRATTNITDHIRHGNQITGTITPFNGNIAVAITVEVAGEVTFGVMITPHEFPLATKAYHQHPTFAFGAGEARFNINSDTGIGDNGVVKGFVEGPNHWHPRRVAVGDGIEVFFHVRRKFIVDDIGEIADQQIGHRHPQHRGGKALIG